MLVISTSFFQAVATCVKYGLNSVSISRIRLPTSGFSKGTLSYTCPTGTSLLSCNTHTYWYKKGVSGLADANSRTCSINCALIHSGSGCSLYVKCLSTVFQNAISLLPYHKCSLLQKTSLTRRGMSDGVDNLRAIASLICVCCLFLYV